mmetsp:Transcript_11237/g.26851  ORF Transcript_11237/g.26851 Transcript_11237/m.26851 type:complete len:331 (+) Transcript_11237:515-1507(+)
MEIPDKISQRARHREPRVPLPFDVHSVWHVVRVLAYLAPVRVDSLFLLGQLRLVIIAEIQSDDARVSPNSHDTPRIPHMRDVQRVGLMVVYHERRCRTTHGGVQRPLFRVSCFLLENQLGLVEGVAQGLGRISHERLLLNQQLRQIALHEVRHVVASPSMTVKNPVQRHKLVHFQNQKRILIGTDGLETLFASKTNTKRRWVEDVLFSPCSHCAEILALKRLPAVHVAISFGADCEGQPSRQGRSLSRETREPRDCSVDRVQQVGLVQLHQRSAVHITIYDALRIHLFETEAAPQLSVLVDSSRLACYPASAPHQKTGRHRRMAWKLVPD